ncbi:MAG: hypothetical protein ACJ74Z_19285 [Bryobacteraceae bacterium]
MDDKAVDDKEKPSVPSENNTGALQDISGGLYSVASDIKYGIRDLTKALFAIADSLAPIAQEIRCLSLGPMNDLSRVIDARLEAISTRVEDLSEQVIIATDLFGETAAAAKRERMES